MTLKSHAILLDVLTAAISWVSYAEEGSGSSPWQRPLPSESPPPHGGDLPPYLGPLPIDYVCFPFYGGETDLVCRSFCEGSSPWQRPLPSESPPPHGGDLPPYLGPLPIDYVCFPFYGGETDLVCRSFCESLHCRRFGERIRIRHMILCCCFR